MNDSPNRTPSYDTSKARRTHAIALAINVGFVAICVAFLMLFVLAIAQYQRLSDRLNMSIYYWQNIESQLTIDLSPISNYSALERMAITIQQNVRDDLASVNEINRDIISLYKKNNALRFFASIGLLPDFPAYETTQVEPYVYEDVNKFVQFPAPYASIALGDWDGSNKVYFVSGRYLDRMIGASKSVNETVNQLYQRALALLVASGGFLIISNFFTSFVLLAPAFRAVDRAYQRVVKYYTKLRERDKLTTDTVSALEVPMRLYHHDGTLMFQNRAFKETIIDHLGEENINFAELTLELIKFSKEKKTSTGEIENPKAPQSVQKVGENMIHFRAVAAGKDHYILYGNDVTAELRAQFIEMQKGRVDSLGVLASGVAHDFNNILAGIMANSELIWTTSDLPPNVRTRIEQTIWACERGQSLVSQISQYLRPRQADKKIVRIDEFVELLRNQLFIKNSKIKLSVKSEGTAGLFVDPTMVVTAVENLVRNSADAIGDQEGEIDIMVRADMVREPFIDISVSDSGTGFSNHALKSGFEPFFTTKSTGKGLGLGLSMVNQMVRLNNGLITLSNSKNGACVNVRFPAMPISKISAQKPPDHGVQNGVVLMGSCVILEDEENLLLSQALLLEQVFETVYRARDNNEFQAKLQEMQNCDAALIDWNLPDGTSEESIYLLLERFPHCSVLVYTGSVSGDLRALAERIDITVESKPLRFRDITQKLKTSHQQKA